MTVHDYVIGAVVFVATWGAVSMGSSLILRRRLGYLTGTPRLVAFSLLLAAGLVAVHLVPAMLGLLSRAAVLVTAMLALAVVWRFVSPAPAEREPPPEPLAPSGGGSSAIAIVAAACTAVCALAYFGRVATVPATGTDFMNYHLPVLARWIQTGSIWDNIEYLAYFSTGTYPHNGEVLFLSTILPFKNDAFVRLISFPLIALVGASAYAVARELRAPVSTAALFSAVIVSTPSVMVTALDRMKADSLMLAAFGAGLLFMVRHRRTRRAGDLMLAGLGLGLALGATWNGATAVLALLAVWTIASCVDRGGVGKVLPDAAALAAIVAAAGGVWLVRNLVVTGNPVFPLKVAVAGITIFDAPFDPVRATYGATVGRYLTDTEVLRQSILPEYRVAFGLTGIVVGLGVVLAAGLALTGRHRRGNGGRAAGLILALAAAALAIFIGYLSLPYGAAGASGHPWAGITGENARWSIPAIFIAGAVSAWAVGRLRRWRLPLELLALAGVLDGLAHSFSLSPRDLAVAAVALAGGGGLAWTVQRGCARLVAERRLGPVLALLGIVAAGALALGYFQQRRFNEKRYMGLDRTFDSVIANAPRRSRIGIAGEFDGGLGPVAPMLGPFLDNRVTFVGPLVQGMRREYGRRADYLAALSRGRYDFMLIGRGVPPRPGGPAERWTRMAGLKPVAYSAQYALFRR